jgi:hypothetical protein
VSWTTGHFEPDFPAATAGHPGKKLSLQGLSVTTDHSPLSKWSIHLMTGVIDEGSKNMLDIWQVTHVSNLVQGSGNR